MLKKSILLVGIVMFSFINVVYSHPIGRLATPELFNSLALNYVNVYYSPYTAYLIYEENSTYFFSENTTETKEYYTIYTIENKTYWLNYMIYLTTENDNKIINFYRNFKSQKYKFYENQEVINIFFLKNKPSNCYYFFGCEYNFGRVTYHEKALAGTHYY